MALINLLETEYKIIGSHKVIQMIAEDIEDLAHEFFPSSSSVSPGTLIPALCPDELEIPKQSSTKADKVRVYIFKREGR